MRTASRTILTAILVLSMVACNNKEKKQAMPTGPVGDSSKSVSTENPSNPYASVDISPMDMSYYPTEYPKLKMTKSVSAPPLAKVIYSRPHLQGRKLFPEVLKYGEAWRLGANESTELDLYHDAVIQGKKVKADRYVLYCIPSENKWTIVLNSNIDSWGLTPDPSKDIYRFEIPVSKTGRRIEFFTMVFEKTNEGADLVMAWDGIEARLPIIFQ
jgi:hypothetical protein